MSELRGLPRLPDGLLRWTGLPGAATAHALVQAAEAATGPLCVLAHDPGIAARLEEELRFFGGSGLPILALPDYETLPYDLYSPHPDIISQRLRALARLPDLRRGVVIVDVLCALQRLPPRRFIDAHALSLAVGEELDLEAFRARLVAAGYLGVPQVGAPGEFALRGSLFDIYPMGSEVPYRIDLLDRDLDSIRSFDPESQRSLERVERLELLPAREFPFSPEAIKEFRRRFRVRFPGDLTRMPLYRDLGDGIASAGIEHYLPLFHEQTATLFDYLPAQSVLVLPGDQAAQLAETWRMIEERHAERCHDIERPILDPAELYLDPEQWSALAEQRPRILLQAGSEPDASATTVDFGAEPPPAARLDPRRPESVDGLRTSAACGHPRPHADRRREPGRRETLREMLHTPAHRRQVPDWAAVHRQRRAAGDRRGAGGRRPAAAAGRRRHRRREPDLRRARGAAAPPRRARPTRRLIRNLTELGRAIRSCTSSTAWGAIWASKRWRSAAAAASTWPSNTPTGPRFTCRSAAWSWSTATPAPTPPTRRCTSSAAATGSAPSARRASRCATRRPSCWPSTPSAPPAAGTPSRCRTTTRASRPAFRSRKPPDQARAISEVLADIGSDKPMDRVVCGDVGFGKTEVAMRAAFVAAHAGQQVAVLVPTTLLAQQHAEIVQQPHGRLAAARGGADALRVAQEQQQILADLAAGKLDIVIGTHRLLQKDVKFQRLGLLIIDEEHRFGVKQKEAFKALRAEVDVLTLTATPIPRTLSLAMSGLRDLSIIATPPPRRMAVKTFVRPFDAELVREACLREFKRGGQVYFLHNKVETIERVAHDLAQLLPEATLRVGHGQLPERDARTHHGGLPPPPLQPAGVHAPSSRAASTCRPPTPSSSTAPTPWAWPSCTSCAAGSGARTTRPMRTCWCPAATRSRATRSSAWRPSSPWANWASASRWPATTWKSAAPASCWATSRAATSRRSASRCSTTAGTGRARHPRRPRAGFRRRRAARARTSTWASPALLPTDYVPDVHQRLVLYKRIASAPTTTELDELQVETIDRFGPLEEPARNLFRIARLRIHARACGVERLELGAERRLGHFHRRDANRPRPG